MGNAHGVHERGLDNLSLPRISSSDSSATINLKKEDAQRSISKVKKVTFSEYEHVSEIESFNSKSKRRQRSVSGFVRKIFSYCTTDNLLQCVKERIPVTSWLAEYSYRSNLIPDIVAGLTIAMMHIPQGLVYAELADVDAAVGMYMGVFPVIVYFLLGTSRHVSLGSFAIVSLMTGNAITHAALSDEKIISNATSVNATKTNASQSSMNTSHIQIAISISAMVGIWFLVTFAFNLGRFSLILSKTLVSSFTSGAGIHVVFSQVGPVFGLKLEHNYGTFGLIWHFINITQNIKYTNIATLLLTLITCAILLINTYVFKPQIIKRWGIYPPIELIVIIISTVVSSYTKFSENFNISVIGYIPTGFPSPLVPEPDLMWFLVWESFGIMLVSYSIGMSVAFMLASKCDYDVNPQQELFAFGIANIVGSFFSCLPAGSSLSRSLIQFESGGRTQIASIVSCIFLIIAILFIGPYIEQLPQCVLSAIIIVSITGMLLQLADFIPIWKASTLDGFMWLTTFFSVVLIDVVNGLVLGVFFALVSTYYRSTIPSIGKLGRITLASADSSAPADDIFLDLKNAKVSEIPGTRIMQITSEHLNFANKKHALKKIQEYAGVFPNKVLQHKKELERYKFPAQLVAIDCDRLKTVEFRLYNRPSTTLSDALDSNTETYSRTRKKLKYIIVDLTFVKKMDHSTMLSIKCLVKLYKDIQICMVVVSTDGLLMTMIETEPSIRTAVNKNAIIERPVVTSAD